MIRSKLRKILPHLSKRSLKEKRNSDGFFITMFAIYMGRCELREIFLKIKILKSHSLSNYNLYFCFFFIAITVRITLSLTIITANNKDNEKMCLNVCKNIKLEVIL